MSDDIKPVAWRSIHAADEGTHCYMYNEMGEGEPLYPAAAIEALQAERDEADRRAGAAERHLERLRESEIKQDAWLREAKQAWGVGYNVSFDVVWEEALRVKAERDAALAREKGLREMLEGLLVESTADAVMRKVRAALAAQEADR